MKRINASKIKTRVFFHLPYVVELNSEPMAVLVRFPLTEKDVEETTQELAKLVEEQKDKG
ncbi:MAG: hypothetical protein GWN93_06770 [Deltaproteobacteria bacterium]|nr:hypothetical protein [Deltaproteobacteria bacterium]